MSHYYNTNREDGDQLRASITKAMSQEERITEFFAGRVGAYSPDEVHQQVFGGTVPITSVRRAMTNLTMMGVLVKTEKMVAGRYGKQVHTWARRGTEYGEREEYEKERDARQSISQPGQEPHG